MITLNLITKPSLFISCRLVYSTGSAWPLIGLGNLNLQNWAKCLLSKCTFFEVLVGAPECVALNALGRTKNANRELCEPNHRVADDGMIAHSERLIEAHSERCTERGPLSNAFHWMRNWKRRRNLNIKPLDLLVSANPARGTSIIWSRYTLYCIPYTCYHITKFGV